MFNEKRVIGLMVTTIVLYVLATVLVVTDCKAGIISGAVGGVVAGSIVSNSIEDAQQVKEVKSNLRLKLHLQALRSAYVNNDSGSQANDIVELIEKLITGKDRVWKAYVTCSLLELEMVTESRNMYYRPTTNTIRLINTLISEL